jgi:glucan phosphoethanolaminetransferase (alkaline phosphatase superfamily)
VKNVSRPDQTFWEKIPLRYSGSIVLISAFLAFEVIAIKKFMLKNSGSYTEFLDVFRVCGKDLLFILLVSFLFISFSVIFQKSPQRVLKIGFVIFAFFYSLSLIAQAVLFKKTGFGLTREYIQNFLHNPGEDLKMVLSEAGWVYWFCLLCLLMLFIILSKVPDSLWVKKLEYYLVRGSDRVARRIILIIILVFFISLETLALLPRLEAVHPAIKQVPFIELINGFRPDKKPKECQKLEILPEERQDNPINLMAGDEFRPFNVVLIIFESLSWKYCDIYKPGLETTPFLAELAKKALVIDRLYSVDPHTTKALVPIIAGIYPFPEPAVLEARPGILPEKALPHLLKRFGYRTAFFQTANNYEDRPGLVFNLGYDLFRGLYHMPQEGFSYVNYFGREEMMMLKPSLEWIDEVKGQPFFITYLTLSTHHEYGYPPNFPVRDYGVNNENHNRYLNAVRYTDGFIKNLFNAFEKRSLLNSTIFIIVGDHGEAFGEHGLSGHNYTLWEEGLRVPGIIYAPAILPGAGRTEGFRSVLDIAPTVCDLLGLKLTEGEFIGRSLLSPPDENPEFFYTGWSSSRITGYRKGRYKFIFPVWTPGAEIYDNLVDENDVRDMFETGGRLKAEVNLYKEKTRRWWEAVAVQYREWEQGSRSEFKSNQPEDYAKKIKASIEDLITIYGYGYFPEKTEPGRTVYVRVGIKCENKVKRPLQFKAILYFEENGARTEFNLVPRVPLENLEPGEFTSAETVIAVPAEWPLGLSRLYVGVLDERRGHFLAAAGSGFEVSQEGTVYIGELNLFSAEGDKK